MRQCHLAQIERLVLPLHLQKLILKLERLYRIRLVLEVNGCATLLHELYRLDLDLVIARGPLTNNFVNTVFLVRLVLLTHYNFLKAIDFRLMTNLDRL